MLTIPPEIFEMSVVDLMCPFGIITVEEDKSLKTATALEFDYTDEDTGVRCFSIKVPSIRDGIEELIEIYGATAAA